MELQEGDQRKHNKMMRTISDFMVGNATREEVHSRVDDYLDSVENGGDAE